MRGSLAATPISDRIGSRFGPCSYQSEYGCSTWRRSVREASASGLLFPDGFFPQPLDLLQMVQPVFRHHLHVVCNGDPMAQFGMAGGFLQVFRLQPPQQPYVGVAVESVECNQLRW